MKHIKIVGLCLVAMFAFSAVAAATASAAARPEFLKCGKTPKVEKKLPAGEFANKECTEAQAEGKYRLEAVTFGTPVTGKSKAVTFNVDGKVIKCKKSTSAGEISNEFEATVTITFSKCGVNGSSKEPCGAEGTITTKPLGAGLYFANEEEKEAVVLLEAGGGFAEFTCGTEPIAIEGFVFGSVKNSKKGVTLTFALNGEHKQAVTTGWFFGPLGPATLESAGKEATLEMTDEQGPKGVGAFPS